MKQAELIHELRQRSGFYRIGATWVQGATADALCQEAARHIEAQQAKIDALMLEYCPEDMTPEQIEEWGRHQRPVSAEEEQAIKAALGVPNKV